MLKQNFSETRRAVFFRILGVCFSLIPFSESSFATVPGEPLCPLPKTEVSSQFNGLIDVTSVLRGWPGFAAFDTLLRDPLHNAGGKPIPSERVILPQSNPADYTFSQNFLKTYNPEFDPLRVNSEHPRANLPDFKSAPELNFPRLYPSTQASQSNDVEAIQLIFGTGFPPFTTPSGGV